jgi:hypothetical protein
MTDNQREGLKALGYGALGVLAYLSFGVLVGLASSGL